MALLGSIGGVVWDSQARVELDNSNQKKSMLLLRFMGVLSKGYTMGKPWEAGENAYDMGLWESHIRNLYLLLTLQAVV